MNYWNNDFYVAKRTLKCSRSILCAAFIFFMSSRIVFGSGEAALAPLDNLSMGVSSSAVIEKIKSVGTHSLEPSPWDKRKKVIWRLPDNSNYDKVLFLFTGKDRLFLMRFIVKKETWAEVRNLKKALFERFGVSPENPGRLRVKNQDVLVYEVSKPDHSFFEFTDTQTGEKAFELYDRKVSAEDNAKKGAESNSDGRK